MLKFKLGTFEKNSSTTGLVLLQVPNLGLYKAGERGGQGGGQNTWGPGWLMGPKFGKMSCHWCDCPEGWRPVMCNHLLVQGPDPGSRQPWAYKMLVLIRQLLSLSVPNSNESLNQPKNW